MIERTAAIVENGIVTNVIVITAEHELTENEIEYTADKPAAIGWAFDGTNFINLDPPIESDVE